MFRIIKEIFAFVFGNYSNAILEFLVLTGTINGTTLEAGTIKVANPITGVLSSVTVDSLNITSILEISNNLCNYIILPIADCLLIMYFMFTLIEMTSNENFTLQQFGKALAKVVLFHILILNTFSLMTTILDLGNALVRDTYTVTTTSSSIQAGHTIVDSYFLGDIKITDNAADTYNEISTQYNALKGKGFFKQLNNGLVD